ncbi:MAG TPA: pyridoxine 5'-phosphate synthase [Polyangiaceae bacterium]|nr:pyridoxine 5'-phosphate synthase [Polyangiaceae bacterium]
MRLHINVDHVATVRNARGVHYPDPVFAAQICEQAGADGITCHLREDRRHIRDDDVERLKIAVETLLNLEMAATKEMIAIAARIRPDVITLVPERREERTTEGGLDVVRQKSAIAEALSMAKESGIKTSLFIAPETRDVEAARDAGADQIELHTGEYCHSPAPRELERLRSAARLGHKLDLEVAAGHGLTRHNVVAIAAIEDIEELNIGHAVIADAVMLGLGRAVRGFRDAIDRGVRLRARR